MKQSNRKFLQFYTVLLTSFLVGVSLAHGASGGVKDFKGFVAFLQETIFNPLIGIIFGAAVVFFLWNIFGLIKNSDDAKEREKMKTQAIWGIVGIAVMASMWGLVSFVTDTFGGTRAPLQIPGSQPSCVGVTCSGIPDCARLGTCSGIPNTKPAFPGVENYQ